MRHVCRKFLYKTFKKFKRLEIIRRLKNKVLHKTDLDMSVESSRILLNEMEIWNKQLEFENEIKRGLFSKINPLCF